jgi:uncharacterized membrane protein/predicted DsbA family dithiol-disulfide isomerase
MSQHGGRRGRSVAPMPSLTLQGPRWPRSASFLCGAGMMVFSALTIRHFFAANYPASIWQGSFCDISAFFNCNSSAFSSIAQVLGIPLGYFGLMTGALVSLAALFPSATFERTNKSISLLNVVGVLVLLLYSVLYLRSLCLLCSGYYVFSALSFLLFWKYGIDGDAPGLRARFLQPSLKYLATFAVIVAVGAYGFREFHQTKKQAQSGGAAARIVDQYFGLPMVKPPSLISPYWTARSTDKFEDAPIQVIEYADFLCPDCLYLHGQLAKLKQEFKGKINIAFQFFPLEAKCNAVVPKDLHPGACELAYMAAQDPAKFAQMHDEIFGNYLAAKKNPEWRRDFARRYGVESALTDAATQQRVRQIVDTGAEFDKTSDKFAHGVRSTPTMIINNRMVIGTFPYEQLRAIFQALVDRNEQARRKFLENWQDSGK